ncbi:MAG: UvrD-helicase domain-containing protein [Treponema sp.]|jgi:ATP-dependent helicase/nuclease subunit A|nr:UvrD-helicase domain-containing protein [Treponema sp.]
MELKKKCPELNGEQQAAAYCTENAVVAAGAGSGKTMVLASRFAWLVTEKDCRVNEILTLTFTKKAAAQMYQRIHSLLGEIAENDGGVRGDRARRAIGDFINARIQTLDSYSASLVKQSTSRYGISPRFVIDEIRSWELATEESLPFLIANRHHPAIERLYPQKSPASIAHDIFAAMLFNYCNIDAPPCLEQDVKKQFAIICEEWKKQRTAIEKQLDNLAGVIFQDESLLPDLAPLMKRYKAGGIVFPGEGEIKNFFDFLQALPPDSVVVQSEAHPLQASIVKLLAFMAALNGLNLRKGKKTGNPAKEQIHGLREIFGGFSSLAVFCMQAGLLLSLMSLLSGLQRRYLDKKRSEGVLTFNDVARLARTILLEQQDIRQSEKETFKAIMIDEFQDNNELQKELLFLLAEKDGLMSKGIPRAADISEGKLFFVGDEKQSIYRFRHADVSVFRKLRDELQSRDLPLTINYRSAPLLIGAFNAVFGGSKFDSEGKLPLAENPSVFAANTPSLPLHEASYTPLRAGRTEPGKLTLCIFDKKDAPDTLTEETDRLTPVENEARFVAERIQQMLNEKNESGEAKYRPDDIAILFRARSSQHLFEKHLRLLNIPYASEDLNGFFFGGPVNDIMSVLRLAAYPMDRAAYAEMLRSPFAGLSLQGLAACFTVLNGDESPEPFDEKPLSLLCEEDTLKYKHGQAVYKKICDNTCRASVSSLVSELWYNQGYRYETEWNPQTAVYRELYDYLFHLAARADEENQGLAAFTDFIQDLRISGERLSDIEIPLERPSAVRLLTVHKSKGLEFPVVFLCCCDKYSQRSGGSDVFNTEDAGITLNLPLPAQCSAIAGIKRNFFWERSLSFEKSKRTAELRRLLYVGMTRAEKELYLTGCLGVGRDASCSPQDALAPATQLTPGGFSLRLKHYIQERLEKSEEKNGISGDAILDDDTFFGLCLPAFAARIPPSEGGDAQAGQGSSPCGPGAEPVFFEIEEIPRYTEEYIKESEKRSSALSNDQKGLNIFLEKIEPFYHAADIIETPRLRDKHLTPSSLQQAVNAVEENSNEIQEEKESAPPSSMARILPGRFIISKEYSGDGAGDIFDKVDAMLERYALKNGSDGEKFNSGGFGTIAHVCAEALLNGKEAVIPPKLAGFLSPKEADAFLDAGKKIAERFICSPLGRIAQCAQTRKSEFPFKSLIYDVLGKESLISGAVDLLFEDDQAIHVVDFKTDSKETPSGHVAQMACYFRAVSDLFVASSNKKCRIWLYYLRSGHAVEMTERVKNFNIERAISP